MSLSLNLSNKKITDAEKILGQIPNPEIYISIDLSNNLLKFLPKNISLFKNLQSLNLINNKFTDYNSLSNILSCLPKLQDLNIDLSNQENVLIILSALPNLITLNGQSTSENETTLQQSCDNNVNYFFKEKKNEISLNEETNEFEFIYKELNNEKFNKKFQEKLREEINKINNNLDISNKLYNAIIIKSKLEIYSFILDEVLNLIFGDIINNNDIENINSFSKIINLAKDKLKYNQNILFEIIMNDNNNDNNNIYTINNINNNINQLNINKKNTIYEISNEISIIDSLSTNKIKIIPKNNLISLLDQIYEFKIKINKDYPQAIIPFFTAKYGIKSLANFWYNKILESINYYTEKDKFSEVYLVKLILENKIDEYFYFIYKKNKKKFTNYINNIKTLLESNKNQKEISYEEGMKLLIDHLDDIIDLDKNLIIDDVIESFNKKKEYYLNMEGIYIIKDFKEDFINILMEIYIKRRENKYNRFLSNFKIFDIDNDGLINKEEFIELIYSFKNEYFINNKTIIANLCSELFSKGKINISINNCIEILSKFNINTNKNIFDIIL